MVSYDIKYKGDKKENTVKLTLSRCTRIGDTIQIGPNLYKIVNRVNYEIEVEFHREAPK